MPSIATDSFDFIIPPCKVAVTRGGVTAFNLQGTLFNPVVHRRLGVGALFRREASYWGKSGLRHSQPVQAENAEAGDQQAGGEAYPPVLHEAF